MKKVLSTEEFIKKAIKVHGALYTYDNVLYIGNKNKVMITCKIHGDFNQTPHDHLSGSACKKCGRIRSNEKTSNTIDQFVEKAKEIHGDKYDYDKVDYKNSTTKVIIGCKIHGNFEQRPTNHIKGEGCRKCGYKSNTIKLRKTHEEFLEQAKEIHGGKYSYEFSKYKTIKTKIEITCPKHGNFTQVSGNHLQGQGCPTCGLINKKVNRKNLKTFIEDSNKIHKNIYDYALTEYSNNKTKVKIVCLSHGVFEQTPNSHLSGNGCNRCGIEKTTLKAKFLKEDFVEKANIVHGERYNYNNTVYEDNKTKVEIECSFHGNFLQNANNHLRGAGCPICNKGLYSIKVAERNKEEWEKIPTILYFIKINTEEEEFYKIGLTTKTIKKRFKRDKIKVEVIKELNTNKYKAAIIEATILEENSQYKYIPKIKFEGHTECFSKNIIEI